jgi:hypothetical protein
MSVEEEQKVKRDKELARGPLGEKLAKFPLLFGKAALFGQRPSRTRPVEPGNGTMTFVDLGAGHLGITCQHVIASYRKMRERVEEVVFQVGGVEIDPLSQLIDEDATIDLATIGLTSEQARAIASDGEIGSCVFRPRTWPPPVLEVGDYVAFGGFPATLKTVVRFDELVFGSWSNGNSHISSVSDLGFRSKLNRDYWVVPFGGGGHQMALKAFAGMSGGPAFIHRGLYPDLVGIISMYNEADDEVSFASTRALRADGTIKPPAGWHDSDRWGV